MRRLLLAGLVAAWATSSVLGDSFTFSADSVKSVLAAGKEKTVLSGRAKVKSEKIAISADEIEISGKDYSILVCSGKVEADDEKNGIHLLSSRLTYNRSKSIALLEGPSVLEDRKNRVVMKADWIQDDGDKGITIAQVNVRILKESLVCRSDYAVYRRDEHMLELSGAPRVVKNGDEYRASRMIVNTDTEEIRLEGSVSGSVSTRGEGDSGGAKAEDTKPAEDGLPPPTGQAPGAAAPAGQVPAGSGKARGRRAVRAKAVA